MLPELFLLYWAGMPPNADMVLLAPKKCWQDVTSRGNEPCTAFSQWNVSERVGGLGSNGDERGIF